jgi:hypothetical protein
MDEDFKQRFLRCNFSQFHTAIAEYGGPIAMLKKASSIILGLD